MATDVDDAATVLTEVRRLRERTRAQAHAGAWLPAAVLAVLVLASIVLYRYPFHRPRTLSVDVPYWAGLPDEQRNPVGSYVFWFVGTLVAFGIIAAWYRRRERRVGMRVNWRRFIGVGVGALLAMAVIAAVPVPLPQDVPLGDLGQPSSTWENLRDGVLTPLIPIGLATTVLGVAEHSRALTAAGGWMVVLAWVHCTFGVLSVPGSLTELVVDSSFESQTPPYESSPGPILIAMALPLLVFAVVHGWRTRGASDA